MANPKVDFYFIKAKNWQQELEQMRQIALSCNLTEELKWGHPCYTLNGNNVVLIHDFKEYCAFLFFKGVLLKDPEKILVQQTENVQSALQIRFTNVEQIIKLSKALNGYILHAIEVEKAGLKVDLIKSTALKYAEEFQQKLDKSAALTKAFKALTPGRQRAYNLYFSAAKQAKTRVERVEKCIPGIMDGKGLND